MREILHALAAGGSTRATSAPISSSWLSAAHEEGAATRPTLDIAEEVRATFTNTRRRGWRRA
jgi:hypothetical protein